MRSWQARRGQIVFCCLLVSCLPKELGFAAEETAAGTAGEASGGDVANGGAAAAGSGATTGSGGTGGSGGEAPCEPVGSSCAGSATIVRCGPDGDVSTELCSEPFPVCIDDGVCVECQPDSSRSCYTGPEQTRDVGACESGTQPCLSNRSWSANCEEETLPSNETCDGVDNDCDGEIDEDLGSTTCGTGACRRTVQNCVSAAVQACQPLAPMTESCNGIDDDCNGTPDNLPSVSCGSQCNPPCSGGQPNPNQCQTICPTAMCTGTFCCVTTASCLNGTPCPAGTQARPHSNGRACACCY
jgi:hypothetical protein